LNSTVVGKFVARRRRGRSGHSLKIETCQISEDFEKHVLHKLLCVIDKQTCNTVLYICMQTLKDGYGVCKLTARGIIFENKLSLTARRWKLYPITLGEPCRKKQKNKKTWQIFVHIHPQTH